MRVISGSAKGRILKAVPGKHTRPTSDKVKEAMFSAIGPYFDGGAVLDMFAGTGSFGIEALSRGMNHAVFFDISRAAIEVIKHNLQQTQLHEQAEVFAIDAKRGLPRLAKREMKFDLVFLDPPYEQRQRTHERRGIDMAKLLTSLQTLDLLQADAMVIIEHDARTTYAENYGRLEQMKQAEYGDTMVTYYE